MGICQFDHRKSELVANLLRIYAGRTASDHTQGLAWYPKARHIVWEWSATYGYSVRTVASVTAALSPQTAWDRNLLQAEDVLAGRSTSIGGIQANVHKAQRIRDDRAESTLPYFPHGPKVHCFSENLAGNDTCVTVDTHALQAALCDPQATITLRWRPYLVFGECYTTAAREVGLLPSVFQAIVWHVWKRQYPRIVKYELRRQW
jgi:hypothetical protein